MDSVNINLDQYDPDLNIFNDISSDDNCKTYTISEFNASNMNQNCFSLLNYNIRSFNMNHVALESLIDSLNVHFQCIVLTETWNDHNTIDICSLTNYCGFHTFRPVNHVYSKGGGVTILCDDYFTVKRNDSLCKCNEHIETCVVDFEHSNRKYTIIGIYRPPRGCRTLFIEEISHILLKL